MRGDPVLPGGGVPGGDAARPPGRADRELLSRTCALAMLEHTGCTASASGNAAVTTGDELVMREHSALVGFAGQRAVFRFALGHVARVNRGAAGPAPSSPPALGRVDVAPHGCYGQ